MCDQDIPSSDIENEKGEGQRAEPITPIAPIIDRNEATRPLTPGFTTERYFPDPDIFGINSPDAAWVDRRIRPRYIENRTRALSSQKLLPVGYVHLPVTIWSQVNYFAAENIFCDYDVLAVHPSDPDLNILLQVCSLESYLKACDRLGELKNGDKKDAKLWDRFKLTAETAFQLTAARGNPYYVGPYISSKRTREMRYRGIRAEVKHQTDTFALWKNLPAKDGLDLVRISISNLRGQ